MLKKVTLINEDVRLINIFNITYINKTNNGCTIKFNNNDVINVRNNISEFEKYNIDFLYDTLEVIINNTNVKSELEQKLLNEDFHLINELENENLPNINELNDELQYGLKELSNNEEKRGRTKKEY